MIVVESPGMFTTVQDLGRFGYGTLGVSAAGAADRVALRLGNRLVGNPPGAAGLEMTLLGGVFRFERDSVIALTGGDFECSVPMWRAVAVRAGETVRCGGARSGARCYLCVAGGIDVPAVLGSRSAHALSGIGGGGLRRGAVLSLGAGRGAEAGRGVKPARLYPAGAIHVTPSVQTDWFSPEQRQVFVSTVWRVSNAADRMGLRLEGPPIACAGGGRMLTEGAPLGAVQLPPGGEPIILFVDQQTTGGYPKIASVISADLHRVGQLRPREAVRFEWVTPDEARRRLLELERLAASDELFE